MRTGVEVRFPCGEDEIVGVLDEPEGPGPHPAVVLAHGFGATRSARLDAYAERFRQAGISALAFDYRHFGESGGEPRQLLSIRRQMEDWRAAIRFIRGRPGVDPERVALWGTSFSGGYVVRLAAEDPRVTAVVSQVPFMDGVATTLALHPLSALKAGALGVADLVRAGLGGAPVYMPLVARPGAAAAMAMDEAVEGYERFYRGKEWANRVCARIGLAVPLQRPLRHAARVRCPLLVQVAESDRLTPPGGARRAARAAPRGELESYAAAHFDFYFDELFEETSARQIAFLRRHLSPSGAPARA